MARFPLALLATALLTVAHPAPASADVFKVYGEAHGGGMYGTGVGGDAQAKENAFFAQSRGPAYGALVGAQLLIVDFHIKHHQYPLDDVSTWTQFNLGLSFGVDTGGPEAKKERKGGYVEMGVWAGFGLATGAQVDPPLDNSEVSDKGFMLEARFGFGTHLSSIFDLGLQVPVSWGYVFRNGEGQAANDLSSQYQSVQAEALVVLRANIRLL